MNLDKTSIIIKNKNALSLAFVGDSVWNLYARKYIFESVEVKPNKLHTLASKLVCAEFQAKVYALIKESLNETEEEVANRARNANTNNVPKHSYLEEYKKSTSLEAIIGYNYLTNNLQRVDEIFEIAKQNFSFDV